jgi:hypothetical protein
MQVRMDLLLGQGRVHGEDAFDETVIELQFRQQLVGGPTDVVAAGTLHQLHEGFGSDEMVGVAEQCTTEKERSTEKAENQLTVTSSHLFRH